MTTNSPYSAETAKETALDVCRRYNEQSGSSAIGDQQFFEHDSFRTDLASELAAILEHWFSDGSLDDSQQEKFRAFAELLRTVSKTSPNSKKWLSEQTALIEWTDKCLNEIAAHGYYVGTGTDEDPSLDSFDWLLQAFGNIRCQALLETLAKCVASRFYTDAMYRLSDANGLTLTNTQHFLLATCPQYLLDSDRDKSHCGNIVTSMLGTYGEIFAHFLPLIQRWTMPMMLALVYPIKFILACVHNLSSDEKQAIYELILSILVNGNASELDNTHVHTILLHASLCLLIELIRSNKKLLKDAKSEIEKKSVLATILDDLAKKSSHNKLRLKAVELLSLLVPEEEFLKENNPEQVTGLFVENFTKALDDGRTEKADQILSGLKDLVQNDQVKAELVKQNGLPAIMKYAKQTSDDPLPLEITYALTFNSDAKQAFKQDGDFVDHIQQLRQSKTEKISKVAHGIMWKLEGEEKFQKQEEEKKNNPVKENEAGEGPTKYDMMISYCWAQQPLCHRINDRLERDGYSVWLDRDEMHGSIIERMAEAIENSRFVLICMSSNYKNSTNCKAEAEYAFNRKSKIVPLLVESSYKADGWLGFLAGSKIYVEFADKDEEDDFEKAYQLLIGELESHGLKDEPKAASASGAEPKVAEVKEQPKTPPPIETRDYLRVGAPPLWNETHVEEFLAHNQLEAFIPVCESMDGPALIEFQRACQSMPDKLFGLINGRKGEQGISLGLFFRFMSRVQTHLQAMPPRKVHFQYNFVYPPSVSPGGK